MSYKPQSKINTDQTTAWVEPDKVSVYFKIWHDCLASYDDVGDFEWIYEDPNLSTFANEFLNDLSLDEETKHEPLTLRQMLYLDEFLDNVESEIVNHENIENTEDIAAIVEETQYLRSQLGKQSKEWIAKKLSNVLAKIRREGPTVFKSVFKEIGKQVISQGVRFLFEHPDKLLG